MTGQKQAKLSGLRSDLERRILRGLAGEWDVALWVLDEPYHGMMKKPLFSLGDLTTTLGRWNPGKREIRLSRNLVFNHTWDAVRDVLRHEMAHQMAHQIFDGADEPAHGPAFRKSCRMLRANPRASGTYPTLTEAVFQKELAPEDARLRQIQKLMALAESPNRHEAESAMAKAHQLIAKYNIRTLGKNENKSIFTIFLGEPALRRYRDVYALAALISEFYFVEGVWVPAFVVEKGKMGSALEISGTPANLQMADYVYHYVRRFVDSEWELYNGRKTMNRHRKTDFAVGIIQGLREKLTRHAENKGRRPASERKAVIRLTDAFLGDYMAHRYPRTRKIYRAASCPDDRVMQDGVRLGKALVISKGVSHVEKSGRLLPEP